MKVITKNIFPLSLLWLFIFPTSVQLHHHHDGEVNIRHDVGISLHDKHETCPVCDFHFPLFSSHLFTGVKTPEVIAFQKLVINFCQPEFSTLLQVATVRGPPVNFPD